MGTLFYEIRDDETYIGQICDHPFPLHVHDVVEIVCLTSGVQKMTISGTQYTITAGDITVVFPAIPHSYDFVSKDASGVTLIFSPDIISEFTYQLRSMALEHPVLAQAEKLPELDVLISDMQKRFPHYGKGLVYGYLHLFLSFLFKCVKPVPMEKQMHYDLSCQVLRYIGEHYLEPITLETVARMLGVSRIHLSHVFSQQLRINFRQYINALRIDRACFLLRNPAHSISEVAYLCGYGNPRTFHRAFLAQCRMTPTQYRRQFVEPDSIFQEEDVYT